MKILLNLGIVLLTSTAMAQSIESSDFCSSRGQREIDQQIRLIQDAIENGEMDIKLANFFLISTESMQENLNFICKGTPLPTEAALSPRQRQLNIIKKGITNGDIDSDLAQYFLNNLSELYPR